MSTDAKKQPQQQHLSQWDDFPQIELYMDQLLTYVNRQPGINMNRTAMTKSMVNNYIKQGLVRRPYGKRYGPEHLAELIMLTFLKEILPLPQCKELFDVFNVHENAEAVYRAFCQQLACIADTYTENHQKVELSPPEQALYYSLISFAGRQAALDVLAQAQK